MIANVSTLNTLLSQNVCEIIFLRRRSIPPGKVAFRRMLCTNNLKLLSGPRGRTALNFSPARSLPAFNAAQKQLVITWDIFMQDYRCVNVAPPACSIVNIIPADDRFWKYFVEKIAKLTAEEKEQNERSNASALGRCLA